MKKIIIFCLLMIALVCNAADNAAIPKQLTTKTGVEMVFIPPGSFIMGNNNAYLGDNLFFIKFHRYTLLFSTHGPNKLSRGRAY